MMSFVHCFSYKLFILFSVLAVLFAACTHQMDVPIVTPAPGRVVINEILYNPVGNNIGNQLVELKNVGSEPVALKGWWLCARQDYAQLPDMTLNPDSLVVVHIRATGTNTAKDVYLPNMLPLQPISDLNLYRDANFVSPASMIHFVQWAGVPPIGRQDEAISAGLWTAGDFIPDVIEGRSIVYDGEGFSSSDWMEATATIGF